MKKLLLLLLFPFVLFACGSDDKDKDEDIDDPKSIVGVWENDNYFVSFNSDGFYSAYIADEFIDSGNYTRSESKVSCENTYFRRKTIYTIKSISDTKLNVDITYTDVYGENQNKTIVFTKSSAIPSSKNNTLAGKSYAYNSSGLKVVTMSFTTFNFGIKTATSANASKYPLKFFYINIGDKLYHQTLEDHSIQVPTIGGWTTGYNTVRCWKLSFNANGSIDGIEVISL